MKSWSGCVQLSLFEAEEPQDKLSHPNGTSASSAAVLVALSDDFPEEIKAMAYQVIALQLLSCLAEPSLESEPLSGGHHVR